MNMIHLNIKSGLTVISHTNSGNKQNQTNKIGKLKTENLSNTTLINMKICPIQNLLI